jgi:CBS-domain-containing membrane protein
MDSVRDLMIPLNEYSNIDQNATLEEAVDLMYRSIYEKGYRTLAVLDGGGNVIGFLTSRAVFEALGKLAPKAGGWLGISFNRPELFFWDGLKLIKDTPVKKLLRPVVDAYVREGDYPSRAVEMILKRGVTLLPVLDERDKMTGVIRSVDLLPFIKKLFTSKNS